MKFCDRRTVVSIPNGPSELAVKEAAWGLARYAAISQVYIYPTIFKSPELSAVEKLKDHHIGFIFNMHVHSYIKSLKHLIYLSK